LAKIAVALQEAVRQRVLNGGAGGATARRLAEGAGWRVVDVICTSGPDDRPFEEAHASVSISMIVAGTFQYRTHTRRELLAPGAILLGNPGQSYECAHEHGNGDRCISFQYTPAFFERIVQSHPGFRTARLPPLRAASPLVARACAAVEGASEAAWNTAAWEELAIEVAGQTLRLANDVDVDGSAAAGQSAISRVSRAVRAIELHHADALSLDALAQDAGLSPYHFLRTFTRITGVTPHQFALRTRLRDAATRLALDDARVIDVALDCGFGDVSNFNRTFRAEFGVAPRQYRAALNFRERPPSRARIHNGGTAPSRRPKSASHCL